MRPDAESFGWDRAVTAGLVAVCPIVELELSCYFPTTAAGAHADGRLHRLGWVVKGTQRPTQTIWLRLEAGARKELDQGRPEHGERPVVIM